ncbi:MAG: hypothetical protein JKY56_03210 [Kofleriaceae bacterium]|nr:hypothetical protein [Kofleriaceae bacterium]
MESHLGLAGNPSPATEVLVSALADIDKESAQVLFLQAQGPYDLDDYQSVPALFPTPLFASTELDCASSEGALIWRALPHLSQGNLQDRVAALSVVLFSLGDAMTHDRNPPALLALVKPIAATLGSDNSPALREGGKLLQVIGDRLERVFGFV